MAIAPDRLTIPAHVVRIALACLVLATASLSGCSCRVETEAERAARLAKEEAERLERERKRLEEERKRAPVLLDDLQVMPTTGEGLSLYAKTGHWNAIRQPAAANAEDFDGVISLETIPGKGSDRSLASRVVSRRPMVLAAKTQKVVDTLLYCPEDAGRSKLQSYVRDRRSGQLVHDQSTPLLQLADHQYHFVVLAPEPARYAFLSSLQSFDAKPPYGLEGTEPLATSGLPFWKNYRLAGVKVGAAPGEIALPDDFNAWTSVAYLLWDEVDPALLTPSQRLAIVDWINWGGQLIVSGPESLDLLRGSFLEPVLSAKSSGTKELNASELDQLEVIWSAGRFGTPLDQSKPWQGIQLEAIEPGRSLPGLGDLVIERRVGRGRVVVTAFRLSSPALLAWSQGVDNFFNGALLRRPPRKFVMADPGGREYLKEGELPERAVVWTDQEHPSTIDPRINSRFYAFTRDTLDTPDDFRYRRRTQDNAFGGLSEAILAPVARGGVGAVRDFNPPAQQARDSLRSSAGVSVPGVSFVVGCLFFYLLVLVPANWGLFYALGRVELAWVAAPLIALAGAWVVIQQARLDIGFVRAQTEVAVLELQPETPRGLLTRYNALYTSLSTTYDLEFDNPAVAALFPSGVEGPRFGPTKSVIYERQEKARLKDIRVASASTEFVRSDEMIDLGELGVPGSSVPGSIRLTKGVGAEVRLENRTAWELRDVMVVERPSEAREEAYLEGCWIGDLPAGETASVVFFPIDSIPTKEQEEASQEKLAAPPLIFPQQRADAAALRRELPSSIDLEDLIRLATDPNRFEPGQRRVIAVLPDSLPGLTIDPPASQKTGATLIVGNLNYGLLPPPKSDQNGPLDVR